MLGSKYIASVFVSTMKYQDILCPLAGFGTVASISGLSRPNQDSSTVDGIVRHLASMPVTSYFVTLRQAVNRMWCAVGLALSLDAYMSMLVHSV